MAVRRARLPSTATLLFITTSRRACGTSGSEEYDRLELLGVLISDYEERHNPIDDSDLTPQQIVEFMAEQKGLTRGELAEVMGGRSRLSDFLRGERSLSKGQIEALREHLGIPADLLL